MVKKYLSKLLKKKPLFKVGDKVKLIEYCNSGIKIDKNVKINDHGIIIEIYSDGLYDNYPYAVDFGNGERWWMSDTSIELVKLFKIGERNV